MVTLQSADGVQLTFTPKMSRLSTYLASKKANYVAKVNIPGILLGKMFHFVEHWADLEMPALPKPLLQGEFHESVGQWNAQFFEGAPLPLVCQLAVAASELGILWLTHLAMAKLAHELRFKSPQMAAPLFQPVSHSFTPANVRALSSLSSVPCFSLD